MYDFEVSVLDDRIVLIDPVTGFYGIYAMHPTRSQLISVRRRPTRNEGLVELAWQAANDKARELGWIV
jgi:hypothetical protein